MSEEEIKELEAKKEIRKSWVRVIVTYVAAGFLFGGGAAFILFLIRCGEIDKALTLFNTLLPVAAAIISYWFAGRNQPKESKN